MDIEARLIATLQADPALAGVLVRYGYTDGDDENTVPTLPRIVLERTSTEFIETICGVDPSCCFVNLVLTIYAKECDEARTLGYAAWKALRESEDEPSIQDFSDVYQTPDRSWALPQLYRVWDDAPGVA